jgi:hypothetical protein
MINHGVPVINKQHSIQTYIEYSSALTETWHHTLENGCLHCLSPYFRERRFSTHWIGDSVRPSVVDTEGKKRNSASAGNLNLLP